MSLVIVHGGISVDTERLAEVTAAAETFQKACLAETGCAEYQLSWRIGGTGLLRLLEVWETQEDYAAHGEQAHVKEWTTFISGAATAPPAFTKLIVEEV